MTTTICGHCGDRIDGVSLEDHDDECQPECFRCAESFDAKTGNLWHDCPERDAEGEDSDPPQPDRIPERERLERRERQREADGRAERRRLGRER